MRYIKWAILLILIASITIQVDAQSTTTPCDISCELSWTPPTEYEDGSALLEQELDFYSVYCDGNHIMDFDSIIGTWTIEFSFGVPGTYDCGLTTTALNEQESSLSNTKLFTKGPRVPKPPTLL